MDVTLAALDKELDKHGKEIRHLEAELFFRRLRLAALKSVKDAFLRELAIKEREDPGG